MLAYCQSVCLPSFLSSLSVPISAFLPICLSAFHSVCLSVFCLPSSLHTLPVPNLAVLPICLSDMLPSCLSVHLMSSFRVGVRKSRHDGRNTEKDIHTEGQSDRRTERRGYARPELPGCCESCDQNCQYCIIFREVISSSLTKFVCCAIFIKRWMRLDMLSSNPYPPPPPE